MNAKQRKRWMTRRHMDWPIGAKVLVLKIFEGFETKIGTVNKHWKEHPYSCSIAFTDGMFSIYTVRIPFTKLFLIDTRLRGLRPWWKTHQEEWGIKRRRLFAVKIQELEERDVGHAILRSEE